MSDQRKQCPFCGSSQLRIEDDEIISKRQYVFCVDCAARGSEERASPNGDAAWAAWDKRAGEKK